MELATLAYVLWEKALRAGHEEFISDILGRGSF